MILTGLPIGELCALRWRDVDLARGKLLVAQSKTDAGEWLIDLSPSLLDELKVHRVDARFAKPSDLCSRPGTGRAATAAT